MSESSLETNRLSCSPIPSPIRSVTVSLMVTLPLTYASSNRRFQLLCEVHLINQTADGVDTNAVYVSLQFLNVIITEATTTTTSSSATTTVNVETTTSTPSSSAATTTVHAHNMVYYGTSNEGPSRQNRDIYTEVYKGRFLGSL